MVAAACEAAGTGAVGGPAARVTCRADAVAASCRAAAAPVAS